MDEPGKDLFQRLNCGPSAMLSILVQKRQLNFLYEVLKKHHPDSVKEWEALKKTWTEEAKEEIQKLFPAVEFNFKE